MGIECSPDQGANLLMHVLRQVVLTASIFTGGARTFPPAKGLETWPGTCRSSLRAVDIVHTRLDIFKVPFNVILRAIETRSQTIIHTICLVHGFILIFHTGDGGDGQEHLILPQVMVQGYVCHQGWLAEITFGISALREYFSTRQESDHLG